MEENVDGADEYAVSGWVKWVDTPKMMVWNTVVRVTSNRNNQDMNNPGDRTLTILKSNGYYSFNTYSCIEECKMNLNDKIKYDQ